MASDLNGVVMHNRKEPKFISFGGEHGIAEGRTIEGVFLRVDRIEKEGKQVPRMVFAEGEIHDARFCASGDRFAFLAPYSLQQSIEMTDIGHFIQIRYLGAERVNAQKNPMMRFDVGVSEQTYITQAGISDSDIPF